MTDDYIITQKYGEAAKIFECLPKVFTEEETDVVLQAYEVCISHILELLSLETDPFITDCLNNILTQIRWQEQKITEAYNSRLRVEQSTKINLGTNYSYESNNRKRKGAQDNKYEYRQEIIKLSKCNVTGNGLSELCGLENVKSMLKKSIILPMTYPNLFIGGRKPWTQILLYGPPGTGKSKIAYALAAETKANLHCISSADLLSAWVGESEKMIKDLFEFIRNSEEKCLLFIDEIDSICRTRTAKEGDHTRSIKNQLLIELDRNISCGSSCFVLCATNCPWDIDLAFIRRFQCRIFVPLPDRASRIEIMQKASEGINTNLTVDEWKIISERTNDYSCADLINLTNFALQEPLGELENNNTWLVKNDKWIPCAMNTPMCVKVPLSLVPSEKVCARDVTLKDFIKAMDVVPKTMNNGVLERYKEYAKTN